MNVLRVGIPHFLGDASLTRQVQRRNDSVAHGRRGEREGRSVFSGHPGVVEEEPLALSDANASYARLRRNRQLEVELVRLYKGARVARLELEIFERRLKRPVRGSRVVRRACLLRRLQGIVNRVP